MTFGFDVVRGTDISRIVRSARSEIVEVVRQAYLIHHAGSSVNPNSYFLRFPDKPSARIIALPAYLGGEFDVAGIKWIGSFPANVTRNVPRASAVLLLNDYETGYPFACLEASHISAARTAASAVLGAEQLLGRRTADRIAVVGSGVIARTIVEFLAHEWRVRNFVVHDTVADYADHLVDHIRRNLGCDAEPAPTLEAAVRDSDVVALATTAAEPYIAKPDTFAAGQVVLNVSLRDIDPGIILASANVLDDVEHCLHADTSPHLAEQAVGTRDFIDGTLAQLLLGELTLGDDRPKIFSPFGLGVLDLAVGSFVYRRAREDGKTAAIDGFFAETQRWSR